MRPATRIRVWIALTVLWLAGSAWAQTGGGAASNATTPDQMARGKKVFQRVCWVCHQLNGAGLPGIFPPLARSDFLVADKERSIRTVMTGLTEAIVVNNKPFHGVMPPMVLDDDGIADVLTYVRESWKNGGDPVSPLEVRAVRAKLHFATYEQMQGAGAYRPLPEPPLGFSVREVARMPDSPVRFASDGSGRVIYVLCANADVYRLEPATGNLRQILAGAAFIDPAHGDANCVGFCLDAKRRFYMVVNQRNASGDIVTNEVTIYRTTALQEGDPDKPVPWFRTSYPWGIGPFNHGVGNIEIGPDGFLYVSSGSRTDGDETGNDPHLWKGGEHELTSCIWRLDPSSAKPEIEIYARGVRNPYGFCWDAQGAMYATDNGPDANAPEELNHIERGRHYGFPYTFSNWTNKPYAYTPDPPPGQVFTLPVANLGPAGGGGGSPLYTFDPHSSPAGIIYLGDTFPAANRGTFWLVRFGNLLRLDKDVGFDLLQARIKAGPNGGEEAEITTLMSPLSRPLDLHISGGRIYLAEYSRSVDNRADSGFSSGRILELAPR